MSVVKKKKNAVRLTEGASRECRPVGAIKCCVIQERKKGWEIIVNEEVNAL